MSTAIGLSGGWISRSISDSDVQEIKNARTINDIGSIWGKIKDWFCGTHKEEAKRILFSLLNDRVTTKDKVVAFERLKELSSEPYKENFNHVDGEFSIKRPLGDTLFRMKKDFIEIDKKEIASYMMADSKNPEQAKDNFKKDFSRSLPHGVYSINGKKVTSEEDLNCFSDDELSCIRAIANQRLFGTIIDIGINRQQALFDCPSDDMGLKYDITRQSDGKIKLTASCYKDAASGTNFDQIIGMIRESDQFKRCVSITAEFEIDQADITAKNIEYYSVN
ncbi:hypothetical protein [Aeromonas veronii]|uniref:hypothetical protein n=1 Tax=Aeromonas veronii TaxID=654 RepID=UPI003A8C626B